MWIIHHHGLHPPLIPSFSIFGEAPERQRQAEVSHQESCSSSSFTRESLHLLSEPVSSSSVMRCLILFPEMRTVNTASSSHPKFPRYRTIVPGLIAEEPCDSFFPLHHLLKINDESCVYMAVAPRREEYITSSTSGRLKSTYSTSSCRKIVTSFRLAKVSMY
jgi:hypothetical protein